MAVPKFRTSRSKRGSRRSHHALAYASWKICPSCGGQRPHHSACPHCGEYRGRVITSPRSAGGAPNAEAAG